MKIFLLLWVFFHTSFATPLQDHKIDPSALLELTTALHIEGDLVAKTQKHWLRSSGKERWEIKELEPSQKSFVLNWAEKHGYFAEWKPSCQSYDVALILGAATHRMQDRLNYLKKLWIEGTRFDQIVWLTGDRPLDPRVDRFLDICKTESEASRVLWRNTELPEEMRNLPVIFIPRPPQNRRYDVYLVKHAKNFLQSLVYF